MSLKAQIARDIDRVFLNLKDFAEEVVWEGQTVNAVVQDDLSEDSKGVEGVHHRAVHQHRIAVYLKASEIERPKPKGFVEFNSEKYRVVSAEDVFGLLKVVLEKKRQ